MTNNIEKKLTSTEIIIDEIANTILSGELKPGDKLLTEREFAEKYHVTRSCVREAIRSLSLIGITFRSESSGFLSAVYTLCGSYCFNQT